MLTVAYHTLDWYTAKLRRCEPYSSLLYGDGEFQVLMGERTGQAFTHYCEVVTPSLVTEMWDSLRNPDADLVRGTDPILVHYRDYGGSDYNSVFALGSRIERTLTEAGLGDMEMANGTIWETCVRDGLLGPFLQELRDHPLIVIGNSGLKTLARRLDAYAFIDVPETNAAASLDQLERRTLISHTPGAVYLLCMGLGAIPLIMRLRRINRDGTYLDLGSVLDVFAGLGSERGWRSELYRDRAAWDALITKNLEGV